MQVDLDLNGISELEKERLIPSYLIDRNKSFDGYATISPCSENIFDKIRLLEADMENMQEKLRKIERVMPWVSEDFEMDENSKN